MNLIVAPIIKIARYKNKGEEYGSDEIFSTTCHETAHSSHYRWVNAMPYWTTTTQVRESWAIAVEWRLSHLEYAERGISNYGEFNYHPSPIPQYPNDYAYQYWNSGISGNYTPLFIDLADGHNQIGINYGFYTGIVNDNVSGYNLPLVEINILPHIHNLSTLANRLKLNKPTGVTDAQIEELLSFY